MYNRDLKLAIGDINDKKNMISISLTKSIRQEIEAATRWLDTLYPKVPLKIRCLIILNDTVQENIKRCPNCDKPAGFDKTNGFNKFCSDACSKLYGRLPQATKSLLNDYQWLYNKRINERMSYTRIAELLHCSGNPIIQACKRLNIPKINLTESDYTIKEKLNDKDWLLTNYKEDHKTLVNIAEEINSSKSTLSLAIKKHGIEANPTNSYNRGHVEVSGECMEVYEYIKEILPENTEIKLNDRTILNGREIDILIPALAVGFEYNGIYHHIHKHSENTINKTKSYHLDKTIDARNAGIKLFHIFSDDWMLNKDVVKDFISAKLGKLSSVVFARKCEIAIPSLTEKIKFMSENHLQGKDKSSIVIGLKFGDDFVSMMTFCKSRYNKNYMWELSRYAVKRNTNVVGGFSRLLTNFRQNHSGSIISYADRSYSNGDVYYKNGFKLIKTNPPSYKYVNLGKSIKRMHRANFMKKKLAPGDSRPEWKVMFDAGYKQIFDCGTLSFCIA